MRKIFLILILTLLLTSCFWQKETAIKESNEKQENTKNIQENKNKEILVQISENDIRSKTKYLVNFTWIQTKYFNNNKDIWLLLSYIWNMEYQGYIEKKEKEYAKIIVAMWEEFIKQSTKNKELKQYDKTILISKLFKIIWNNYEVLWENKKAIESYKKSIKKNPNNYKNYIDLWNLYKNIGEKEKSKEVFIKVKEVIKNTKIIEKTNNLINIIGKDDYYWGYMDLGLIYMILWDVEKSQSYLKKAKKIIDEGTFLNNYEKGKDLMKFKNIY